MSPHGAPIPQAWNTPANGELVWLPSHETAMKKDSFQTANQAAFSFSSSAALEVIPVNRSTKRPFL